MVLFQKYINSKNCLNDLDFFILKWSIWYGLMEYKVIPLEIKHLVLEKIEKTRPYLTNSLDFINFV